MIVYRISPEHLARMLRWARQIADTRSTCVRRKVGAVLIDATGMSRSTGRNQEREGLRCDQGDCPRGLKTLDQQPAYAPYDDCIAEHAEAMALRLPVDRRGRGPWLLVVTDEPCSTCHILCIDHHVGVVWPEKAQTWFPDLPAGYFGGKEE